MATLDLSAAAAAASARAAAAAASKPKKTDVEFTVRVTVPLGSRHREDVKANLLAAVNAVESKASFVEYVQELS